MKKRIFSFMLAIIMLVGIVPGITYTAFAATTDDADVQAVYNAYTTLQNALTSNSIGELETASKDFEAILDTYNNLSEEQKNELGTLLGVNVEEAFSMILLDWVKTNVILETNKLYKAYLDNPNAKTAYDFVEYYKLLNEDAETKKIVENFIIDLNQVYNDAVANLPSEDTLAIYNAYISVHDALASNSISELEKASKDFETILNTYNDMGEKEMKELAVLLEANVEEALSMILSDWVNANVILETNKLYQAYLDKPNVKNATNFTEQYDVIFNIPEYKDETLRKLIREFITDIDDVYNDAMTYLSANNDKKADNNNKENEKDSPDVDSNLKSPETGDNSNLWLLLALALIISSVLLGTTVYSKIRKETK